MTNDTITFDGTRYIRATPDGLDLATAPAYYRKLFRLPDVTPITVERRTTAPHHDLTGIINGILT